MPRVVHFEINADDPGRASAFYSNVFGWKIQKWDGPMEYWLVDTGEGAMGINGGLLKRSCPEATTVNTVDVPSFDDYEKKILAVGGTTVMPKTPVMGMGYMGYFKDTEGNIFGIMEMDESAK